MAADIPPPVIHILDKATFSNITEQMRSMYRDTMAPRLGEFESDLDLQLAVDFDTSLKARFDLDGVLRGDFETRAEAVSKLVTNGIMMPAEARPLFSLGKAGPEAERLYANQATQPLGTPVAGAGPVPAAAPATAGKAPQVDAVRVVRSALGALAGVKGIPDATRARLVDEHAKQLAVFFGKQRDAVLMNTAHKAAGYFDAPTWDGALADLLAALGTATAKAMGSATAAALGGSFDIAAMAEWIRDNAAQAATAINATTLEQLAAELAGPEDPGTAVNHVYDVLTGSRTAQIAKTRVTAVGGHAQRTGAAQAGASHKTWITGPNPRPDHAAMSGETAPLGEPFSNGMQGPGDSSGGADEVAGCNCSLEFTKGAS